MHGEIVNGLAVCAGIGGLELGLRIALPAYRTVCYVEKDVRAAATLVARMDDETLDRAPIWDDIETFDGTAWRGSVDIVSAGFPCQPWSYAGQRNKDEDSRWIWPSIFKAGCDAGAAIWFLENVTGLADGGLELVLRDLALGGFDAEWDVFSEAYQGGSQVRRRLFILAYARSDRRSLQLSRVQTLDIRRRLNSLVEAPPGIGYPPRVEDSVRWHGISPELAPLRQSRVHGVADGATSRMDRIRLIGSAVVPSVAAMALGELTNRLVFA